jgi:AcrR family transcriptional regulator
MNTVLLSSIMPKASSRRPPTGEPGRPYHSPLRDAQAAQTRQLILDTMIELLAGGQADNFSIRQLASEAGVSERTVYRYFPDRETLLDGLNGYLTSAMGTAVQEAELADLDQLVDFLPTVFESFDAMPEVTKAGILINPDPARVVPTQRRRTERMIDLARRTFPDLDDADVVRLGQLVRTVTSTYNWLRMREEFGLSGAESADLLGWALQCALDEVRRTGRVGSNRDDVRP